MVEEAVEVNAKPRENARLSWVLDILLVLILIAGASLRLVGVNWDQNKHLHPDERFLTMVETSIQPVKSLAEYFDTAHSTLNPNNVGYGFFVYGTLPVFITRYVAEWTNMSGYDQVNLVGRVLSAVADLFTVLLVYMIGARLYNRRVGVLAAAFSAFAVLQIQLSHYFTVDTFTNTFTFLAFYCAVRLTDRVFETRLPNGENSGNQHSPVELPGIALFILFGVALGLAVASKINAAVLAAILPVAVGIRISRLPRERWQSVAIQAVEYMLLAAVVSLVVFRIFQPYAFTGPGFFNVRLNPKWLSTMQELRAQSTGDVDAPFALQWYGRPIWFALYNLVAWGLGWPLGILAWAGFLWMGWRMIKGEWREHLLIWAWTGGYFAWVSIQLTRTMRYLILIYPTLAIIAAWAIVRLWDTGSIQRSFRGWKIHLQGKRVKILAGVIGLVALTFTGAWAFAFTRIYTRPLTRVEASYWFFQNVPGPIQLQVKTSNGEFNQEVGYHPAAVINQTGPYVLQFTPETSGSLVDIRLEHVLVRQAPFAQQTLGVSVAKSADFSALLATGSITANFLADGDPNGKAYILNLDRPVTLDPKQSYYLRFTTVEGDILELSGQVSLTLSTAGGPYSQPLPNLVQTIQPGSPYSVQFSAQTNGSVQKIQLTHVLDRVGEPGSKTLQVSLSSLMGNGGQTTTGEVSSSFGPGDNNLNWLGNTYEVTLNQPVQLVKGQAYSLNLTQTQGNGALVVYGSQPAKESDWDDDVPQPLNNYPSPGDIYQIGALNLQLYWPDEPTAYGDPLEAKLNRLETILDQADYIVITSSRQWGSITRVPQRYPLSTVYYRDLIGCPDNQSILKCYADAQPGSYQGKLGFELVKVFQSNPNLGGFQINDQLAEEAFTVYDHPKVMIFKKSADFSRTQVDNLLGAVDTSHVVHVLPNGKIIGPNQSSMDLLLPAARWAADQAAGTWSALFSRLSILNQDPGVGVIAWYLGIFLMGLIAYPLVRLALPGLADRGYPLARLAGLLMLAYLSWISGSFNIPFGRTTISLFIGLLFLLAIALAYLQRNELRTEWRTKRKYFLAVEFLALVAFLIDLGIRYGNPDLWHPAFGGEKPMDFSYFNAILKSPSFPPYDPWFSGGYINYYYYGFVIAGVLVKWLGIIPSIAYNLILPAWFMFLALGAFSLGWNLMGGEKLLAQDTGLEDGTTPKPRFWQKLLEPLRWRSFQIGLAALIGFLILGNLGTVRMIWYGFQKLVAPNGSVDGASVLQHWAWFFQGLPKYLGGERLPYYPGDWYWQPSRVIIPAAGNEITEFPMFTILYADPHAHLFALPITLLVIAWALSVILACGRWGKAKERFSWVGLVAGFGLGGIAVGALYPANTWDYYTYLMLASMALGYAFIRYPHSAWGKRFGMPDWVGRVILAGGAVLVLALLSRLFYQPFYSWFGQAYNSLQSWKGDHTPFWSYLTHWGLFLFVIISWMFWETHEWMQATPLSSLRKLRPYLIWIEIGGFALAFAVIALLILGVEIAWLVLPIAAWAAILIFRPDLPDTKRFVLFLVGSGLTLTLMVELVAVQGDIGRMNTVFKFYLQAWSMLAISAAAGFGWLITAVARQWRPGWRDVWSVALTALVCGAAMFPLMAGRGKINDRMTPTAPHTLDGMTYMKYSHYTTGPTGVSVDMDLNQDYEAIRWMQDNIKGSPVIAEAIEPIQYNWFSRFSIYTGLSDVVGWEWHQIQQHATLPDSVVKGRVQEVENFYTTTDLQQTVNFLRKYNVRYIVVGQLEAAFYPAEGLAKFSQQNGILWKQVYHQVDTSIYEVISTNLPTGLVGR